MDRLAFIVKKGIVEGVDRLAFIVFTQGLALLVKTQIPQLLNGCGFKPIQILTIKTQILNGFGFKPTHIQQLLNGCVRGFKGFGHGKGRKGSQLSTVNQPIATHAPE